MVKPESVTLCVCVVCVVRKPVLLAAVAAATVGVFTLSHSRTLGGRATAFNNLAGSSRQDRRRSPPHRVQTGRSRASIICASTARGLRCLRSPGARASSGGLIAPCRGLAPSPRYTRLRFFN